jgi:hypothetical protein
LFVSNLLGYFENISCNIVNIIVNLLM